MSHGRRGRSWQDLKDSPRVRPWRSSPQASGFQNHRIQVCQHLTEVMVKEGGSRENVTFGERGEIKWEPLTAFAMPMGPHKCAFILGCKEEANNLRERKCDFVILSAVMNYSYVREERAPETLASAPTGGREAIL